MFCDRGINEFKKVAIKNDTQIEELRRGNEFVYRRLYEMHYNELCAYIYNLSRDKQQAEDIVQNVMLKIWKNRKSLRITTSIKSYLYKSCYYELLDSYKRNKKELNYIEQIKKDALELFVEEDNDFVKNRIIKVREEIEKLPPKCKEVFVLNKLQGFKYKEVAEQLNVSIKTVEAQMYKAMTRIKKSLESKD
ncbi:RNA polymerase sigma factor [Aquimarina aquimarini]|uniref:RNA polymerase sigma factor n=1 Tax=Aquimarina aquimarini TaxID=1191734 RepID=UPI000D54D1EC|nr:RNA polymerase sigma-70 factor [Aquimarina aquimarini]